MEAECTPAVACSDEISGIRSKQDLLTLAEVLDSETYTVKRTTFVYLDRNEDAWFGCVEGKRKQDVTVENVKTSLSRVPDTTFPRAPPDLTAPLEALPKSYTKRPKLILLDDDTEAKLLPQMFLDEVRVLEFLKQHPHPNIVQYYGCRVQRDRVMGIFLERHEIVLRDFCDKDLRHGIAGCLKGIRAGIDHLHSLGLAHNDLNPSNILLDGNGNPIIIDFGSCRVFGDQLVSAGTPGWADDYETSERQHDEVAFTKIATWMNDRAECLQTPN